MTEATSISDRPATPRTRPPRAMQAGCAVCAIGAIAWACWPLRTPVVATSPKPLELATSVASPKARSLELAAFRTPLWVVPPPPPAPPSPPPPPPPLRLQLIAIVSDTAATTNTNSGTQSGTGPAPSAIQVRAALLYDPDQDKLFRVHQGETLNGRTIERITEKDVLIRDGAGARTLALRTDAPSSGGAEP